MSDLDLDAIEARADAATEGPWWADSTEIYGGTYDESRYTDDGERVWVAESCHPDSGDGGEANAEFIAHARTDVPALIAEVKALRATVAAQDATLQRVKARIAYADRVGDTGVSLGDLHRALASEATDTDEQEGD